MATAEANRRIPFSRAQELITYDASADLTAADAIKNSYHQNKSQAVVASAQPLPSPALALPAAYGVRKEKLLVVRAVDQSDAASINAYLCSHLDLSRLNKLQEHLSLAGLKQPARALHYQLLVGREIAVTEAADLHLLWQGSTLYLKPLPDFLLCYDMWETHIKHDTSLYLNATGFLLSYIWLILNPVDFALAKERHLLNPHITWPQWCSFTREILMVIDFEERTGVNPRFRYGELRLWRVNWIRRFCSNGWTFSDFVRGHHYNYREYGTFFTTNTKWLLSAVVYVTLVLTAMQVGLVTDRLANNEAFQAASFGFTVFAIVAPLGVFGIFLVVLAFLVLWNAWFVLRQKRWRKKMMKDKD